MDSHQIPLAAGEQLQDLLPVGLGFSGGGAPALGGIRTQNLADERRERPAPARSGACSLLGVQFQNGGPLDGLNIGFFLLGMRSAKRFSCWRRCSICPRTAWRCGRSISAAPARPVASGRGSKSRSHVQIALQGGGPGGGVCGSAGGWVLKNNSGWSRRRWRVRGEASRQAAYSCPACRVLQ